MYDAGKEDYLRPSEHIGLDWIGLDSLHISVYCIGRTVLQTVSQKLTATLMFRISSEADDLSSESGSGKIISVYLYSIHYSEYTFFTQRAGDSLQRNVYLFSILSSSLTFCDVIFV